MLALKFCAVAVTVVMASACTPALLCRLVINPACVAALAVHAILAAFTLAVMFPSQVTITPLKLALLPSAVPISSNVSNAPAAPLVNVLSCVSTYPFNAVLATTMAAFAAAMLFVLIRIAALAAATLALTPANVAITALAAATLAFMPVITELVGK